MGLVVDALTKFAKSDMGTRLYKWGASSQGKKFLCTSLPLIETAVATGSRVIATEKQDLDRREKNILQAGHIVPAVIGIGVGSKLNKKAYELGDKITEHLDPSKVKDIHNIKAALHVIGPIVVTASLMRFLLPVATAFISGEIEERRAKKKLDIKA